MSAPVVREKCHRGRLAAGWADEGGKITNQSTVQPVTVAGKGQFTTRDSGTDITDEEPAYPVFLSQSGRAMTLPGGVLLALDPAWTKARTDAFFRNSVSSANISELVYLADGFFIETEPGFHSLYLTNALAVLDGVETAGPNLQRELTAK